MRDFYGDKVLIDLTVYCYAVDLWRCGVYNSELPRGNSCVEEISNAYNTVHSALM